MICAGAIPNIMKAADKAARHEKQLERFQSAPSSAFRTDMERGPKD